MLATETKASSPSTHNSHKRALNKQIKSHGNNKFALAQNNKEAEEFLNKLYQEGLQLLKNKDDKKKFKKKR